MSAIMPLRWRNISPTRPAAQFSLPAANHFEQISLEDLKAYRIILTFIPGIWAPWSRKLLSEMDELVTELLPGYELIAIAAQQLQQLREYAVAEGLKLTLLSDEYGVISKRYGVLDESVTQPLGISKPSIYILNSRKRIMTVFVGRHLMDRPTKEEIFHHVMQEYEDEQKKAPRIRLLTRIAYASS